MAAEAAALAAVALATLAAVALAAVAALTSPFVTPAGFGSDLYRTPGFLRSQHPLGDFCRFQPVET